MTLSTGRDAAAHGITLVRRVAFVAPVEGLQSNRGIAANREECRIFSDILW